MLYQPVSEGLNCCHFYCCLVSYEDASSFLVTVLSLVSTDDKKKTLSIMVWFRFDLWCLTPLSTIFQLYWWRKPEYLEKTTDLSQVTDKPFNNYGTKQYDTNLLFKTGHEYMYPVVCLMLKKSSVDGENCQKDHF